MTFFCFRKSVRLLRFGLGTLALASLAACATRESTPAPIAQARVRPVEAAPAQAAVAKPAAAPERIERAQPRPIESVPAGDAQAPQAPRDATVVPAVVYGNDSRREAQAAQSNQAAPPVADQTPITPLPLPRAEPVHPGANRPYRVFNQPYTPETSSKVRIKSRGVASWYGRPFHGQRTASGEIFDMYAMSAAHTTLVIPSYVRLTHLASGRQVMLRINDRGPFKPNRLIDVSFAAARALGFVSQGVAEVEMETVSAEEAREFISRAPPMSVQASLGGGASTGAVAVIPASASRSVATPQVSRPNAEPLVVQSETPPGFFAQLGAFKDAASAKRLAEKLLKLPSMQGAVQQVMNQGVLRVMLGPYAQRQDAVSAGEAAGAALGLSAFVHERK